MADFGIKPDIAMGVKGPQQMSLSDLMGIARGAQAYQQAAEYNPMIIEEKRIALGVEQQKEKERKNLMTFFSNPENFQTNGIVDIDKVNASVPTIAPLTGTEVMQKMAGVSKDQTAAFSASQTLTQDQRKIIAGPLTILGRMGVDDPAAYTAELKDLKEQNPGNKALHRAIDTQIKLFEHVPSGQKLAPQYAIRQGQSLLNPTEAESAFAPKAGTLSTGGELTQVVTQPAVGGVGPSITRSGQSFPMTMAPGSRVVATGRVDPQTNAPTAYVLDKDGRLLGEVPIPGSVSPGQSMVGPGGQPAASPGAPASVSSTVPQTAAPSGAAAQMQSAFDANKVNRIPAGESQQTYDAVKEIRERARKGMENIGTERFNSNQIIKLADQTSTGTGADIVAQLGGQFVGMPWTTDAATNLNSLKHYMSMQTQALSASAGFGTDASRALAQGIAGNTNWTADAIKATARVNRALTLGTELFGNGVEKAISESGGNQFAARPFMNKWQTTLSRGGMEGLLLADAFREGDKQAAAKVIKDLGGVNSARYKRAVDSIREMEKLTGSKLLEQ